MVTLCHVHAWRPRGNPGPAQGVPVAGDEYRPALPAPKDGLLGESAEVALELPRLNLDHLFLRRDGNRVGADTAVEIFGQIEGKGPLPWARDRKRTRLNS